MGHMLPYKSAFIVYRAVHDLCVRMVYQTYAPVLGKLSAIISLNGKYLLVGEILHVPNPDTPLCTLRTHQRQ